MFSKAAQLKSVGKRSFSTGKQPYLFDPLPNVPASQYEAVAPTPKVSMSSSGIKVATLSTKSPVVSLGYYVNSGSRNEHDSTVGASFFLSHLGFQSTAQRTSLQVTRDPDTFGGNYSVSSSRENILYSVEVLSDEIKPAHNHLFDVLQPSLREYEVKNVKHLVEASIDKLESSPENLSLELAHQEAFRNRGLGNSLYTPRYRVGALKNKYLSQFHRDHYKVSNITLVGIGGVDHEKLVQYVDEAFSGNKFQDGNAPASSRSEYFGGDLRVAGDGATTIVLGFKGVSFTDAKNPTAAVLQHLLGHNVHSTSKPGVGLSSHLGSLVKSSQFITKANTFNFSYSDNGLFGVQLVTNSHVDQVLHKVAEVLKTLASSPVSSAQLQRAKLQSKLHFHTSHRDAVLNFVHQQSLHTNEFKSPAQYSNLLDSVSASDVQSLAKQIFSSNPTLVVLGDVHNVPTIKSLQLS